MTASTSVTLSDDFRGFIDAQVGSGRFASPSEVVQEGLRLLQQREQQVARLRDAIREGEESGDPIDFDMEAWLDEQDRLDSAA
jgi:antitoxin ParD1/3/4